MPSAATKKKELEKKKSGKLSKSQVRPQWACLCVEEELGKGAQSGRPPRSNGASPSGHVVVLAFAQIESMLNFH